MKILRRSHEHRRLGTLLPWFAPWFRPPRRQARTPAISRNGIYGISSAADAELLSLDVGSPDHLGPLLGFLSHQLSEFGRRHRHGLAGKLGQTGLQLRVGQYRVHRLI